MASDYPIPRFLNLFLCCGLLASYLFLLWFSTSVETIPSLVLVAVVFALMMIPVYSLLHEATHGILHPNQKINYLLGVFLGTLFMTSFTFLRRAHIGHHRRNRTDFEMFDLYYPHESRFKKTLFLYINMIGFYWSSLPFSVLVFLVWPGILQTRPFLANLSIGAMIRGIEKHLLPKIRLESLFVILFHLMLFWGLKLKIFPYLLLFGLHAFTWSSQNYVNHAFAIRDIVNGAHNHYMGFFSRRLYLNFNHHLVHHQKPTLSWYYLPQFVAQDDPSRMPYWKAWLRLWKGPIETTEGPPKEVEEFFREFKELQ